jgi:hypothetical protein
MTNQPIFTKAVRTKAKARIALDGPSGSGKTYSALIAAQAFGGKVAVIDTERGSASLYSDLFDFDVLELTNFHPANYVRAIQAAESAGYNVIVIDSLSHAWEGEGGTLDLADAAAKRMKTPNSFTAWKDVTPIQRNLVDTILQTSMHVIITMRTKTEYSIDKNEQGKTTITRVGLAPVQRQGIEYEFTIFGDLDLQHNLAITKTRYTGYVDVVVSKPDVKFWKKFVDWLGSGEDKPAPPLVITPPAVQQPLVSYLVDDQNGSPVAVAAPPTSNGRPLPATVVPEAISVKAQQFAQGVASIAKRKELTKAISEVVNEEYFKKVMAFMFSVPEMSTVPSAKVLAALEWAKDPVYQEELRGILDYIIGIETQAANVVTETEGE